MRAHLMAYLIILQADGLRQRLRRCGKQSSILTFPHACGIMLLRIWKCPRHEEHFVRVDKIVRVQKHQQIVVDGAIEMPTT